MPLLVLVFLDSHRPHAVPLVYNVKACVIAIKRNSSRFQNRCPLHSTVDTRELPGVVIGKGAFPRIYRDAGVDEDGEGFVSVSVLSCELTVLRGVLHEKRVAASKSLFVRAARETPVRLVNVDLPSRTLHEEPLLAVNVAGGGDPAGGVDARPHIAGGQVLPRSSEGDAVFGVNAEGFGDA